MRARRILLIALLASAILSVVPAPVRGARPPAARTVGATPAPLVGTDVLGPAPPDQPLSLVIFLTPRQPDLLDAYLRRGAGRRRRAALTPDGFGRLFGLSDADQSALIAYLSSFGLRVVRTYPDRLLLDVAGTVGQADAAFGVAMVRYKGHDGLTHDANTAAPRLPAPLAGLVNTIVGLRDDAAPYRPLLRSGATVRQQAPRGHKPMVEPVRPIKERVHPPTSDTPGASLARGVSLVASVPTPPPGLLTPGNIQSAYDITPIYTGTITSTSGQTSTMSITGTGQTIALFELAPYDPADIIAYDDAFSLTSTMPTSIPVDGGATDSFGFSGQLEASLDIELAQAVAPGARLLVYNGPASPTGTNQTTVDDVYARIVNDDQAQVLSTSWGQCEAAQQADTPPDLTLVHTLLAQAVAEGMTVLAASGDQGAYDCTTPTGEVDRSAHGVDYPASDPLALAVGGTVLQLAHDGSVAAEPGWANSGGGLSGVFARPDWQAGPGVANSLSNGHRQLPDVAMDAGQSYAILENGSWTAVGGTSAGPPIWSGLLGLVNETRAGNPPGQGTQAAESCAAASGLGDIHSELYGLGGTTAYHDTTTGPTNGFSAPGPGWDYVTGWGTPDANILLHDLLAAPALAPPAPCSSPTPSASATPSPSLTSVPTSMSSPTVGVPSATAVPTPSPTVGVPSASATNTVPPLVATPTAISTVSASPTTTATPTNTPMVTPTTSPTNTPIATTTGTPTTTALDTRTSMPTPVAAATSTNSPTMASVPTATTIGKPATCTTADYRSASSHTPRTPVQASGARCRSVKPRGPGRPHGRRGLGHAGHGLPRLTVALFTWSLRGRDEFAVRVRAHWLPHEWVSLSLTVDGRASRRVAVRANVHGLARYVFPIHLARRGRRHRYDTIVLRARGSTNHGYAYKVARLTLPG